MGVPSILLNKSAESHSGEESQSHEDPHPHIWCLQDLAEAGTCLLHFLSLTS